MADITTTISNFKYVNKNSDHITAYYEDAGEIYIASTPTASNNIITINESNYRLKVGGQIVVKFSNDVVAGTSLKFTNTVAKPIYLNGSAIETGDILTGMTVTMIYTGTAYEILSVPISNSKIDSLFATTS